MYVRCASRRATSRNIFLQSLHQSAKFTEGSRREAGENATRTKPILKACGGQAALCDLTRKWAACAAAVRSSGVNSIELLLTSNVAAVDMTDGCSGGGA